MMNFLTDFIYFICYRTCLRRYKRWLDVDRRIITESKKEMKDNEIENKKLLTFSEIYEILTKTETKKIL